MRKTVVLVALGALAAAELGWAQGRRRTVNLGELSTFEIEVRRFDSDLTSELRLSTPDLPGTDIDPILTLGLPQERTIDVHVAVRLTRRLKARGSWFRIGYDSDVVTAGELRAAGTRFPPGSRLTSMLELEQRRGGAEYDLLSGEYGFVAVGAEWARFQAKKSFQTTALRASPATSRMDLPLLGAHTRLYLTPALAVSLEWMGMKRQSVGVSSELDVGVVYNAIPSLAFTYGYRNSYQRFKDMEPASRELYRIRGQYFGVIVRF